MNYAIIVKAWLAPGANNTQQWMDRLKDSSQSDFEGEDRAPTVSFFSFPGKGALAYPLFPPASISVPTDHCTVLPVFV